MEEGIAAPMTAVVSATTLPLPNPPSSLAATATTTIIALTWQENLQPNGLPIGYYQIYRGTTPGDLTQVASATGAKYTATSLSASTTYYFEVVAVDTGHGASTPSDQMAVSTASMPAAPVGVVATATSTTQITVGWSANIAPGGLPLSAYYILRGTAPSSLTKVGGATATAYTDYSLTPGTTYYYAVEEVDQSGNISPWSAVVPAATLALPTAPANLAATPVSTRQIGLTWTAGPSGLPVASYQIFRGTAPSSLTQVANATAPAFNDFPPAPGTTYYYAIAEKDSIGNVSPMSAVISAATLARQEATGQRHQARVQLASALGLPLRALDGVRFSFAGLDQFPRELTGPEVRRQAILNRADVRARWPSTPPASPRSSLKSPDNIPTFILVPATNWIKRTTNGRWA